MVGSRLVGHTDSVTAVDATYIGSQLLVVSSSADCTLRVWMSTHDSAGKNCSNLKLMSDSPRNLYKKLCTRNLSGCRKFSYN